MTGFLAKLKSPDPPWVHKTSMELTALMSQLAYLKSEQDFLIATLDGSKMQTIDGLYDQFASQLRFPDYFGRNSAALNDCLTDLAWLEFSGLCIVITASSELLKKSKRADDMEWLIRRLNDAGEEWNNSVDDGNWWDRLPVPFHVIFHSTDDSLEQLALELAALPELKTQ